MEAKKGKTVAAILLVCMLLCLPVSAKEEPRLVPVGASIGIHVDASALLVIGVSEVETASGTCSPAWDAGIRVGDLITAVGATRVSTAGQLRDALRGQSGEVAVRYVRSGREQQVTVTPVVNAEGEPELGLWLRSGLSGIGTMTFYDPESGLFGALGHAVSDGETGVMLPLQSGFVGKARVESILRGAQGKPGELKGELGLDAPLGGLEDNTPQGVFGYLTEVGAAAADGEAIPLCPLRDLQCGEVLLLSDVSGEVRAYGAQIERVYRDSGGTRDLLLTVTDPALLELTGGVVQGMSGSPILKDGRLVGAVTHVLVNNPTKGYGISIEKMLGAAECATDRAA